jgi:hypothetical protein
LVKKVVWLKIMIEEDEVENILSAEISLDRGNCIEKTSALILDVVPETDIVPEKEYDELRKRGGIEDRIILLLAAEGPKTGYEAAKELRMTGGYWNTIKNRLEDNGFICRLHGYDLKKDRRRRVYFWLTVPRGVFFALGLGADHILLFNYARKVYGDSERLKMLETMAEGLDAPAPVDSTNC